MSLVVCLHYYYYNESWLSSAYFVFARDKHFPHTFLLTYEAEVIQLPKCIHIIGNHRA